MTINIKNLSNSSQLLSSALNDKRFKGHYKTNAEFLSAENHDNSCSAFIGTIFFAGFTFWAALEKLNLSYFLPLNLIVGIIIACYLSEKLFTRRKEVQALQHHFIQGRNVVFNKLALNKEFMNTLSSLIENREILPYKKNKEYFNVLNYSSFEEYPIDQTTDMYNFLISVNDFIRSKLSSLEPSVNQSG